MSFIAGFKIENLTFPIIVGGIVVALFSGGVPYGIGQICNNTY